MMTPTIPMPITKTSSQIPHGEFDDRGAELKLLENDLKALRLVSI